jgi:FkbM family methyltransferase
MSESEPDAGGGGSAAPEPKRLGLPEMALRVARALSRVERRVLTLQLLEDEAEEVTFRRKGIRWTGLSWDRMVSASLFVSGGFQGDEVRAVGNWMARHGRFDHGRDVVVDVGANLGTTAIPFARARPDCRVVAIEPVPDLFAVLCRNVADNGLTERVLCIQAAITASGVERVQMVLPVHNSGAGELRREGRAPSFARRHAVRGIVEVPAAGLAEVLQTHAITPDRIAFVWSDTQGSETEVIVSGGPLWTGGVPLFVEFDPQALDGTSGTEAAAARHFARFVPAVRLMTGTAGAEPRPIGELAAFCREMGTRGHDVLLLPEEPAPTGRRSAPA